MIVVSDGFRIGADCRLEKTTTLTSYLIKAKPGAVDLKGNPIEYDPDRMYAKINEEQDLALIQFLSFDVLLKPLSWFETDPGIKKKNPEKE